MYTYLLVNMVKMKDQFKSYLHIELNQAGEFHYKGTNVDTESIPISVGSKEQTKYKGKLKKVATMWVHFNWEKNKIKIRSAGYSRSYDAQATKGKETYVKAFLSETEGGFRFTLNDFKNSFNISRHISKVKCKQAGHKATELLITKIEEGRKNCDWKITVNKKLEDMTCLKF